MKEEGVWEIGKKKMLPGFLRLLGIDKEESERGNNYGGV